MKKALVTGSTGFIGPHLVRELLSRGYEVRCLVRYTSDLTLLRGLPVSLYIGDVREPQTLTEPLRDVEYVFHLAAKLLVPVREAFEETNTQGTINMLEATVQCASGTLKRFLYVSSQAAAGPNSSATPYDETYEPKPISWYGTSKKKAEDAVRSYADRLPVTIVRPSSVYGEEEKDISQVFPAVELGLRPKLGLNTKYVVMVYVGDLVKGMVDAAESDNTLNQTYFLNRADILTAMDVVNVGAKIVGKPNGPVIPVPMFLIRLVAPLGDLLYYLSRKRPPITRDKALELSQLYWLANPAKAKRDFGWEAAHSLEEGLTKTIRYWQQQKESVRQQIVNMPTRERAIVTFGLSIMVGLIEALIDLPLGGILLIGLAHALGLLAPPWWLTVFSIVVVFGVLMGAVALITARRPLIWQFIGGAAMGAGLELINQLWLHWWSWNPATFGRIPGPWLPPLLLGIPAGLYPILINAVVGFLYRRRLRYS